MPAIKLALSVDDAAAFLHRHNKCAPGFTTGIFEKRKTARTDT